MRGSSRRIWPLAASVAPGATVSGFWRSMEAANAMLGKNALDRGLAQLGGLGRRRRLMPQRQEPRRGQVVAGNLQRLRIVAPQLLAHPIAEPVELRREIIAHARP